MLKTGVCWITAKIYQVWHYSHESLLLYGRTAETSEPQTIIHGAEIPQPFLFTSSLVSSNVFTVSLYFFCCLSLWSLNYPTVPLSVRCCAQGHDLRNADIEGCSTLNSFSIENYWVGTHFLKLHRKWGSLFFISNEQWEQKKYTKKWSIQVCVPGLLCWTPCQTGCQLKAKYSTTPLKTKQGSSKHNPMHQVSLNSMELTCLELQP